MANYSRILLKYFLSEGVACKHDLFIASADENPVDIVSVIYLLKIPIYLNIRRTKQKRSESVILSSSSNHRLAVFSVFSIRN